MKQIVKRVPAHTTRSFQCEVCRTKYHTAKQAKKCESRELEIKEFGKGDWVRNKEKRTCGLTGKNYYFDGLITMVLGPMIPDREYEIKWLGSKRLNMHVYEYQVQYNCPECSQEKEARYYGPELQSSEVVKKYSRR